MKRIAVAIAVVGPVIAFTQDKIAYRSWVESFVPGVISNVAPGIVDSKIPGAVAGFPTYKAVTNTTRDVVAMTGRYVWDAEHSVCYRLHPHGGFLDLIAVTNINVTLPGNEAALQAIENEWRAK